MYMYEVVFLNLTKSVVLSTDLICFRSRNKNAVCMYMYVHVHTDMLGPDHCPRYWVGTEGVLESA